jgi:hypothetical protein
VGPIDELTSSPLEYHFIVSNIARIIYTHGRNVKNSLAGVRETLHKLHRISQGLPHHLQITEIANFVPPNEHFPWTLIQRSSLDSLLQACRTNLCFSRLPHLLDTRDDEFSLQECGRQAAMRLVEIQQLTQTITANKLWGTTASLMAAGMFLLLDLICFKSSKSVDLIHPVRQCERLPNRAPDLLIVSFKRTPIYKCEVKYELNFNK